MPSEERFFRIFRRRGRTGRSVPGPFGFAFRVVVAFALLILPSACGFPDPLSGIESLSPGEFMDLAEGRLYLPSSWHAESGERYTAAVVLHGYSQGERGMSEMPVWKALADEKRMVLFFVRSETVGWGEFRDAPDSKRILSVLKAFRRKPWLSEKGLTLFGWSAGAIVATGFASWNQPDWVGRPLFDRLFAYSGFIGYRLEKDLEKDPELRGAVRVPVFFCWGEQEPRDPPRKAVELFTRLGYTVRTATHGGGHFLTERLIRQGFEE